MTNDDRPLDPRPDAPDGGPPRRPEAPSDTDTLAAVGASDGLNAGADRPVSPVEEHDGQAGIDTELDAARAEVIDAIARWLENAWDQAIQRALAANTARALENAPAFPELRRALQALQSTVRDTVERQVAPLLDPGVPSEQTLTRGVDAAMLELVGLIGAPLKAAGFEAHSAGLERVHDGYRLKTMTEHDQIEGALQRLSALRTERAAERAALVALELELAKAEVARLWAATDTDT